MEITSFADLYQNQSSTIRNVTFVFKYILQKSNLIWQHPYKKTQASKEDHVVLTIFYR